MIRSVHKERIKRCIGLMRKENLDVLLLAKPSNMFYLTGDGRLCSFAMITQQGTVALGVPKTDIEDVQKTASFDHIMGFDDEIGMIHAIAHYFKEFGILKGSVGLEYTFLTQSMMSMLTHPHGKPEGVEPMDCTPIMSLLRIVKDEEEIDRMCAAAFVAQEGIAAAIKVLKPGITESRVAAEAEYAMRHAGADEFWRTYVSSGPRTNIAHGLPTQRKIQKRDLVMIDIHPIVNGYSADMCRTVIVGSATTEQKHAYEHFLTAQQATIEAIRAGVSMVDLEKTFHGTLKETGHEKHIFGPPIHGVGIEFEEAPLPAGHAFFHGEKKPGSLQAGTVLAVGNCGIYTGPWGVRIEDTVLVTRDRKSVV